MSDTPKTDAIAEAMEHLGPGGRALHIGNLWQLARDLERKLKVAEQALNMTAKIGGDTPKTEEFYKTFSVFDLSAEAIAFSIVCAALERALKEAERKLKVAEQALAEMLPFAERGIKELNKLMFGELYPRINMAALDRARAALKDIRS